MSAPRAATVVRDGPLRPGERFLKYTIRGLLGTGGHAWVYHGHDEFLDVGVAIKILHRPGGVTRDMLRRGQAEAKLLYRLKHEHIVSVLDAGITDEGLLYIVMELLEGETLRRVLLKKGRLPVREALPLFARIADGVEAAHTFGAIHRDLKPENIFVLAGSQPKVLDFGIAKVVDAAGWTTEKDVIHGTVLYMSPEQLRGERATAASDVYAFGLVLFEALYGRHPLLLKNPSPTIKELTWMQLSVRPPRLDELDGSIPRVVAKLVERMVLKVPAHRPSSMQECAAAIRASLAGGAGAQFHGDHEVVAAPNVVTDRINDTERTHAAPFEASSVTDPLGRVPTERLTGDIPEEPGRDRPGTIRPVSAGITRTAPPRSGRFDDEERRWMLRWFAASCVLGAAVGGVYVAATGRAASLESAASPAMPAVASNALEVVAEVPAAPPLTALPSPTASASPTAPVPAPAVASASLTAVPASHATPARKAKRDAAAGHPDPAATRQAVGLGSSTPVEPRHLVDTTPILE